ncbi:MAG: DUF368 domain-containing protein, partial [Clostridium sp.]
MINFIKGIAIGIATLIPGVSGGTMSLILGIYDDLIHAISSFLKDWKKHIVLLLQIGLGSLFAFFLFSNIIKFVLVKIPMEIGFFFLGVICGGIPLLYKKATKSKNSPIDFLYLIVGFTLILLMSGDVSAATFTGNSGLVNAAFLTLAGFIIAVALILPGISGSFMLLTLGLYDMTIESISTFYVPFLIPLTIGVLIGTLTTTKIIEGLLKKHPGKTYMLILGFVAGSVISVFP